MASEGALKQRQENETEFGRIVAFSDGVFSIAITLLVLNIGIKKGLTEGQIDNALWGQRDVFFAYAISFAVIGRDDDRGRLLLAQPRGRRPPRAGDARRRASPRADQDR